MGDKALMEVEKNRDGGSSQPGKTLISMEVVYI